MRLLYQPLLIVFSILIISGCNPVPTPKPDPVTIDVKAPPIDDYQHILSVALAPSLTPDDDENPSPDPTPNVEVGDDCPKCEDGWIFADGNRQPCWACDGDGTVDEKDLVNFSSQENSLEAFPEYSVVLSPRVRSDLIAVLERIDKLEEQVKQNSEALSFLGEKDDTPDSQDSVQTEQTDSNQSVSNKETLADASPDNDDAVTYRIVYRGQTYTFNPEKSEFIAESGAVVAYNSDKPISEVRRLSITVGNSKSSIPIVAFKEPTE